MKTRINTVLGTLAVVMFVATASAQQTPSPPPTTPYGAPIGLEAAKNVMAAAEAEVTKEQLGDGHHHSRQHRTPGNAAQIRQHTIWVNRRS
jgi:hypothetical protein